MAYGKGLATTTTATGIIYILVLYWFHKELPNSAGSGA